KLKGVHILIEEEQLVADTIKALKENLDNTNNEETDDNVVHSDEYVNDDVDKMYDAEDVDIGKGDEEMD
nr:hypothetical protein [Tanacetum cinerariifolium]